MTVLNERFSMKCPRCVQKAAPGAASCPHCGYSLQVACGLYGTEAVVAERLMDVDGTLVPEQRQAILDSLDDFGRLFPQLFFLVYLGALPPPASPRQFAFWLLNHAAVTDLDGLQPNERGLLLVVDPRGGTAVLAGGYFLESLMGQEELDLVLKSAAKDFSRADYPAALRTITAALGGLLKRVAREAQRNPRRWPSGLPETVPAGFPPLVRTGEVSLLESMPEASPPEPERPPEEAAPPIAAGRPGRRTRSAARRANPGRR